MVLFALSITNGDVLGPSTLWIFLIVGAGDGVALLYE